jgi:hypothetical protein
VRRDLTEDQRTQITEELSFMILAESGRIKRQAAGARGIEGGRGHKKPLTTNVVKGSDHHERSTIGPIAADAGVSRRKAEQAVAVRKHAPDIGSGRAFARAQQYNR